MVNSNKTIKKNTNNWKIFKNISSTDSDEIIIDSKIENNLPWFSGHFTEMPILPGIAQLYFVFNSISLFKKNKIKITKIKNVRFKQLIKPDDNLKLIVSLQKSEDLIYSFRFLVNDNIASSGIMVTEMID